MTTETVPEENLWLMDKEYEKAEQPIVKFNIPDAVIAERAERYADLIITGIDDKEGIIAVDAALADMRTMRRSVEKLRKQLKKDSLEYGRSVDKEAKRLVALAEPTENRLKGERDKVRQELNRIALAEKEAVDQKMIERLNAFDAVGLRLIRTDVEGMSDEEYESSLAESTATHSATMKADRIAEEERVKLQAEEDAHRKADQKKIDNERAELDRQQAELAAEREKIDAAKREADLAETEREAAEKAKQDDIDRIDREAEEERQKQQAAVAEKARLDALRPDQEKLREVIAAIFSIKVPEVSDDAKMAAEDIQTWLDDMALEISRRIEDM